MDIDPVTMVSPSRSLSVENPPSPEPVDRRLTIRIPVLPRDKLPEGAPAVLAQSGSGVLPRVVLFVRDSFTTAMSRFGIWREYHHRPSYDPEGLLSLDDLSRRPPLPSTEKPGPDGLMPEADSKSEDNPFAPHPNRTVAQVMAWVNNGNNSKSAEEVNDFIHNVILDPEFRREELTDFDCRTENRHLNAAADAAAKDPSSQSESFFGPAFRTAAVSTLR